MVGGPTLILIAGLTCRVGGVVSNDADNDSPGHGTITGVSLRLSVGTAGLCLVTSQDTSLASHTTRKHNYFVFFYICNQTMQNIDFFVTSLFKDNIFLHLLELKSRSYLALLWRYVSLKLQ